MAAFTTPDEKSSRTGIVTGVGIRTTYRCWLLQTLLASPFLVCSKNYYQQHREAMATIGGRSDDPRAMSFA